MAITPEHYESIKTYVDIRYGHFDEKTRYTVLKNYLATASREQGALLKDYSADVITTLTSVNYKEHIDFRGE